MRVRNLANQVVAVAVLLLVPARIGAGETVPPATHLRLAALVEQPAPPMVRHSPEAVLLQKWRALRARMQLEQALVAHCRATPFDCPSDSATEFMAIVDSARTRQGRALIGEINRAVNLAVRPVPDARRHGEADVWTAPLATLAAGQGDCEDYAIAKLGALWAAGIAERDTRLVIVHDARAGEDHAIAMVKVDGRWLALDNKRFTLIESVHLNYRPLFALGGDAINSLAGPAAWALLDDNAGFTMSAKGDPGPSGFNSAPVLL